MPSYADGKDGRFRSCNDERALKKAVNKTPQGHVDLLFNLDNQGVVLERRYDRLGGIEDFDAAIEISKLIVRQVSRDHPNISNFLSGL